jgi:hypothetical protein
MGHATEAMDYFDQARRLYEANQDSRAVVDSLRGLALVALARSDIDGAVRYFRDVATRNPREFGFPSFLEDMRVWPDQGWFKRLQGLYGKTFTDSFNESKKRLESKE